MIKIYDDFLPRELAENLNKEIYKTPEYWWKVAYKFLDEEVKYVGNDLTSINLDYDTKLKESLQKGYFTYRFKRSTKHVEGCSCYECGFNTYLDNAFVDFLKENTYLKNPKRFETFVSVYDKGDFLSTHTDNQRGIAFVFNLTKDWKPEYGGMLHVDEKFYCPKFNSLTIMELPDGGLPHFVSEVTNLAPHQRIAISGWFNES